MVCSICFFARWKILGEGRWNFELVQLFLENSCLRHLEFKACSDFLWHTCCALSVLPRNGKFLVDQLDLCLRQFDLCAGAIFLENTIEDCFVTHA